MANLSRSPIVIFLLCFLLVSAEAQSAAPAAPGPEQMPNAPAPPLVQPLNIRTPANLRIPHSHNPFDAYAPSRVPAPDLANSPRIQHLIRDGKLYISLQDAIALALENNIDLAIARYNLP